MADRARGRNSRFQYVKSRNEHGRGQGSRLGIIQGGSSNSNRNNFNKKVTFKPNSHGNKHFRNNWDNKINLVCQQLNVEFSNQSGPARKKIGQKSLHITNDSHHFRNAFTLQKSLTGWYSIHVLNVDDCDDILKKIQTHVMPVQFFPFNKQFFDNTLGFLVDDFKIAKTLHNASYKIALQDNRKLIIKASVYLPSRGPISFTPVSSEVREKMVEVMASRYNSDTKCLDLSKFYSCPLFTENDLFVPLNRPAVLLAALNIVAQHTKHDLYALSLASNHIYLSEGLVWIRRLFPELKVLDLSDNKFAELKELKCIAGFNIEVLNLSQNPVSNIGDKEKYKHDVQEYFPMIIKLDNSELPSKYKAIVRSKLKMPINLDNSYPVPDVLDPQQPNSLISLVESFLIQFYERYDNNLSRLAVADGYHENSSFTLSCCFISHLMKGNLSRYMAESRNFLKSDNNRPGRNRFLFKGRNNIISFLNKLPKTKHDYGSFVVDVPFANGGMVQIVVNGVFAENFSATNSRNIYRSFCRTFCIVPCASGWSILSDMMFVTSINDELLLESSKRFFCLKPNQTFKKSGFTISKNNGKSNNDLMFVEDNKKITGAIDSMPFNQSVRPVDLLTQVNKSISMATPNCAPPPYQKTACFAYQSSFPINIHEPPPYPGNMLMSTKQNQVTNIQPQSYPAPAAASHQVNLQHLNESFSPSFNSEASSSSSTFVTIHNNQLPAGRLLNSDAIANIDCRMIMIKNFSNESRMRHEWAKKCLEENNWDYAKSLLCFSKIKEKIPSEAFI